MERSGVEGGRGGERGWSIGEGSYLRGVAHRCSDSNSSVGAGSRIGGPQYERTAPLLCRAMPCQARPGQARPGQWRGGGEGLTHTHHAQPSIIVSLFTDTAARPVVREPSIRDSIRGPLAFSVSLSLSVSLRSTELGFRALISRETETSCCASGVRGMNRSEDSFFFYGIRFLLVNFRMELDFFFFRGIELELNWEEGVKQEEGEWLRIVRFEINCWKILVEESLDDEQSREIWDFSKRCLINLEKKEK